MSTALNTSTQDTIVMPDHSVKSSDRNQSSFSFRMPRFNFTRRMRVNDGSQPANRKKLYGILLGLLLVFAVVGGASAAAGYHTYSVIRNLKNQAAELQVTVNATKDHLKTQNLPATDESLKQIDTQLQSMKQEYQRLSYLNALPIGRGYYQDGLHIFAAGEAGIRAGQKTVAAILPHADVLGFTGEGSFEGGTAENRIRLLLETLGEVSPQLDEITAELNVVKDELAQVNPDRALYKREIQGYRVDQLLSDASAGTEAAAEKIQQYRPALEVLPEIAGSNGNRKKYLILFQNDNELRPTGGFMTAYAVMFVEDGKVYPEKSDDIYELDKKFTQRIPIPEKLGKYLTTERYYNLRDMNIHPDFKTSMDEFFEHYQEVRGEPGDIDGIISIDTNVLSDLVKILGPVDVPGYGTFSAETDERCDCPQIIYALSEIVDRPTPYIREDRKGIIAPMMQAILQKAYDAPKEQWPALFTLANQAIEEKHTQFYFINEEHQAAAEAVNAAGRLNDLKDGHDYLAVVDANLGGAKSNLFVEQEVEHEVSAVENGQITKTVTLKYRNPHKPDNCNLEAGQLCLNGTLRDWVRIYVPAGAEIVETAGFDEGSYETYEESGLRVIDGVFRLSPLSNATVKVTYTVPYDNSEVYKLQLRKQAGTDNWKYLMRVDGHEEEVILDKDKVVEIEY